MEIKVSVDGVQRVVCGVTEMTTCQEVVIALAQALGRTGRYTLRENFKGYGRNVTPDERLLESLEKYGQQAREVQLTLHYLGPSTVDWPNKPPVQLRKVEGTGRLRRSSAGAILHRQSLPPLSHLYSKTPPEDLKRPKRKSLTLMEEAWGWLENLGKGRKQQSARDKRENEEKDGGNRQLDNMGAKLNKLVQASSALQGKGKNRTENKKWKHKQKDNEIMLPESTTQHKMQRNKEVCVTKKQVGLSEHEAASDRIGSLKILILQQQATLRALKLKIDTTDEQIFKLEMQQVESMFEEEEQLDFWLNELKAEEGYEKVLQRQFLDLKEKVAECKNKLEEYKIKLQRMDLTNGHSQHQQTKPDDHDNAVTVRKKLDRTSGCLESVTEEKRATDVPEGDGTEKMVITRVESELPYILVTANEIESQLSSPSELREWWSRWTEAQKTTSGSTVKVVQHSEIIHLRSTRV